METLRIPIRYRNQISRLSKEDRLWIFESLMALCDGEDVEQRDTMAGDVLELIFRDAYMMEKKNKKIEDISIGEIVAAYPAKVKRLNPLPEVKGNEVKGNEVKQNEAFEEFWKIYPRKVGKGAVLKSWKKLKPPLDKIKTALQWQKESEQWQKENGQFIPNPLKYLNQSRWEDEKTEKPTLKEYSIK